MPIQQDIMDSIQEQLGGQLGPWLAKIVQEEVEKRLPAEAPGVAPAPEPKKKKRGRPRLPRAYLGGKEFKLDSDPLVRHYEIQQLELIAKRDNLTLEIR